MVGTTLLRIAADHWVPWVRAVEHDNGTFTLDGPMDNLLQTLALKLDFQYELVHPPDRVWGILTRDGNWTGMLGMLQREEVEIALGPFGVSRARETVCDFSEPIYVDSYAILTTRPRLESDWSGFLKPFTSNVWLLVLMASVITCVMLTFIARQESKIFSTPYRYSLATAVLWVLKSLTQDGMKELPKTDGSRLLVVTWLLVSFVFMSSYSSTLTAKLTVPRVVIPINSVEDLVSQTAMPWRLEFGTLLFQYYQEATEGLPKAVFDGSAGTFNDCWTDRKLIAQGQFAGICDKTTMKMDMSWDMSSTGQCRFYITGDSIYSPVMIAVAFKTNSPYKERVDYWILRLRESGLINLWLKNEIGDISQCLRPPSASAATHASALDLDAFMGSFLVLAGGLAAGTLVFLLEMCVAATLKELNTY
ncbi:probable glutamate receptor [Procambarus clarkii]|uniref:probable glutamate receptor n=1 Tax=Procambarus clarkii TaxID=6728 RepID=UPI001E6744BC|nr:glutamate receptor-like [Procambarus clarkii]